MASADATQAVLPSEEEPFGLNRPTPVHEYRVYLDERATTWAVVDEIDYQFAIAHRWHANRSHPGRNGSKEYPVRNTWVARKRVKLYLHVEIQKRTGIPQPSSVFKLVDHRDGDEFNCRRSNLHWVTPRMNRLNLSGAYPYDLLDYLEA